MPAASTKRRVPLVEMFTVADPVVPDDVAAPVGLAAGCVGADVAAGAPARAVAVLSLLLVPPHAAATMAATATSATASQPGFLVSLIAFAILPP